MNNVEVLHIMCCFFQFFYSPVALRNFKKICPQEKVEMTFLVKSVIQLDSQSQITVIIMLIHF